MTAPALDYSSLVRALLRRAAEDRQPAHGTFELTARCNLACRMCYIRRAPAGPGREAEAEIPAAAWLDLARQAVDGGMVFLLVTGGEILARRDFFEIYEPLTRLGLVLALYTNGTLVTRDVAARLAQAPPSRIEITLYGATAHTAEAVTGVPGSQAACLRGIEALLERGLPLGLKTTLTRRNAGELEAMRRMARDRGLPFSASWLLSRRPDGAPSPGADDCRLPADEGVGLEAADRASADEWIEAALKDAAAPAQGNFYCRAGRAAFVIDAAGRMNACSLLPRPAARPLESGFAAAWRSVCAFVDAAPPASPVCGDCGARAFCGRCPAWSLLETGTLTEPVPYLCGIARARRERFGTR
ncbi:MAG TPA: radical SAM protein [Candidatus Aminicenantes bacterium]|nr:radical SAM protein [Candidatus Aminicenantes bacterium]HRY64468.1 radical SAM protein [Candidatus Aminicenantes bacterium]HRZ71381.1 radical SAM protein [Candidatus Aminicenantes bacterium]